MKKLLLAATVLAAISSAPAMANGNNRNTDTEVFSLRANNPAKCNLTANDYTLRIAGNSISDNEGRALTTVGDAVADALDGASVVAWCTGASNTLQMYRTPFVATGTDGTQGADGFNTAVLYDVTLNIDGASRSDGFTPTEGTSDGKGNGPGLGVGSGITLGRFGPSGTGSTVDFAGEESSTAVSNGNLGTVDRDDFATDSNRLIAGRYDSTLTIELTPGV